MSMHATPVKLDESFSIVAQLRMQTLVLMHLFFFQLINLCKNASYQSLMLMLYTGSAILILIKEGGTHTQTSGFTNILKKRVR